MSAKIRLQADLGKVLKELETFGRDTRRDRKKIQRPPAEMLRGELEMAAPIGDKVHYRYSTPKVSKGRKAPKGMGRKVAEYHPGNLGDAIKILPLKSQDTFVGARLEKGTDPQGKFGPGLGMDKSDGYYLHMVEYGTKKWGGRPFYRRTVAKMETPVLAKLKDEAAKSLQKEVNRLQKKL